MTPLLEGYMNACRGNLGALLHQAGDDDAEAETNRAVKLIRQAVEELEDANEQIPEIVVLTGEDDSVPNLSYGAVKRPVLVIRRSDDGWAKGAITCSTASIDKWALKATTMGAAVVYCRSSTGQALCADGHRREIASSPTPCVFSHDTYFDLNEALEAYEIETVARSECPYLQSAWHDTAERVLVAGPEEHMRNSLWFFLKHRLRHHDLDREFTVKAEKPVDVSVTWRSSIKKAFIEVKWVGKARPKSGKVYSRTPADAHAGAEQLRDRYVNPYRTENPDVTLLGYLAVFDVRKTKKKAVSFSAALTDNPLLRLDYVWAMEPHVNA